MGKATLIMFIITLISYGLVIYASSTVRMAEDNWNVVGAGLIAAVLSLITVVCFIIYVILK